MGPVERQEEEEEREEDRRQLRQESRRSRRSRSWSLVRRRRGVYPGAVTVAFFARLGGTAPARDAGERGLLLRRRSVRHGRGVHLGGVDAFHSRTQRTAHLKAAAVKFERHTS